MADIFRMNAAVEVKEVDARIGMGMFLNGVDRCKGDIIYEDAPLVSIQHTANRRFVPCCQHCSRTVGSVRHQFQTIFNEDRFSSIDLSVLPSAVDFIPVYCDCGEVYCSTECAGKAFSSHHRYLCVAHSGISSEAVSEFKFYCLSVEGCGDNLLLLSQLLCVLASRSDGVYTSFTSQIREILTYTNLPFHQVARPGFGQERDAEWVEWLATTIGESFNLLAKALSDQNIIFESFFQNREEAFEICSRILSVFELNNIDVAIPSMLASQVSALPVTSQLVHILREKELVMTALWSDESRGVYEEDEESLDEDEGLDDQGDHMEEEDHMHEDVDHMLNEMRVEISSKPFPELLIEFPNFHGTAFYSSVARTNHSCVPNVSMEYLKGTNIVSCKALERVSIGSELHMSYISNPTEKSKKVRQSLLEDYLFQCQCSLCSK